MKLVFSPAAIEDLQAISAYTLQNWGEAQQTDYLRGLWTKLEEIRAHPQRQRRRTDIAVGCCSARHERHVIFFEISASAIRVLRILHGAMDFNSHLTGGAD